MCCTLSRGGALHLDLPSSHSWKRKIVEGGTLKSSGAWKSLFVMVPKELSKIQSDPRKKNLYGKTITPMSCYELKIDLNSKTLMEVNLICCNLWVTLIR